MKRLWRNYNLSVVLAGLFLLSWTLQTWAGWREFAGQQQAHGQAAAVLGPSGYLWTWTAATMENWQSEFLQLLTFVVLTSFLIHRGSHESKDTDEEFRATLARIERAIAVLNARRESEKPPGPVEWPNERPRFGS